MKKSATMSSAMKVAVVSLVLGCSPILNGGSVLAQEDGPKVRIWDTGKRYVQKNPRQEAFKDKANWKQVPYGKTSAKGDLMIEGETFYLFLFTNREDCVELLPKRGKGVGRPNEIYKVHQNSQGLRNFGYGSRGWGPKILKNTAEEIVVEHAGRGHIASQAITTTYRILASRPWLEIKPVERTNQQGMYTKSRICAYVKPSGDDLIMDSTRVPYKADLKLPAPARTIGVISFSRRARRGGHDFMWFMTFPPGVERNPLTYLGFAADPSAHYEERPLVPADTLPVYLGHGGEFVEDGHAGRPCMGAQYAYLGKGGVVISVLNNPNNWTRENVWREVKKGETYTTSFKAPYAGQWKVAARLLGELDTSDRVNLVKDPGAEGKERLRIKGYDMPIGWGLGRENTSEFSVTTDEAHSGKHSVCMKMTSKTSWGVVAGFVTLGPIGKNALDVKPNTTYYFSFWMKAKGSTKPLSVGPHGWGEPVDRPGGVYMFVENVGTHVPVAARPSEQWRKYDGWCTTGPDTKKLAIALETTGGESRLPIGTTFYFDDVFLGPVVEKTPTRYVHSRVKVEAGQPFTFRSPSDGKLDYILMYLWDRTAGTPKSVRTPMDVYREAIQGKKQ